MLTNLSLVTVTMFYYFLVMREVDVFKHLSKRGTEIIPFHSCGDCGNDYDFSTSLFPLP